MSWQPHIWKISMFLPRSRSLNCVDSVMHITRPTEGEVGEALSDTMETMQNHGWGTDNQNIQKYNKEVKFGRIIWQGHCRKISKPATQNILHSRNAEQSRSTDLLVFGVLEAMYAIFGPDIKTIINKEKKKSFQEKKEATTSDQEKQLLIKQC